MVIALANRRQRRPDDALEGSARASLCAPRRIAAAIVDLPRGTFVASCLVMVVVVSGLCLHADEMLLRCSMLLAYTQRCLSPVTLVDLDHDHGEKVFI